MAQIYASLIKKGLKTIEQVPAAIREQVRELLEKEILETSNLKAQS